MPYDLYGNYHANAQDAYNAEMAQCAEIDARLAYDKARELEQRLDSNQQYSHQVLYQQVDYLLQKVTELEQQMAQLQQENNLNKLKDDPKRI